MSDWRDQARCLGTDPEAFYAKSKGDHASPTVRRLCQDCPVRLECLETALAVRDHDDHGYWGGTTRMQRRRLRAQRADDGQRAAS